MWWTLLLHYITVLRCQAVVMHAKRPSVRATERISVPLDYLIMCDKGVGFKAFAWPVCKHELCNRWESFFACAGLMGNRGQETKNQTTRTDLKVRLGACVQASRVHWMSVFVFPWQAFPWVNERSTHKNIKTCCVCDAKIRCIWYTHKHTANTTEHHEIKRFIDPLTQKMSTSVSKNALELINKR